MQFIFEKDLYNVSSFVVLNGVWEQFEAIHAYLENPTRIKMKRGALKPHFKKSEMRRDLPIGSVVSASSAHTECYTRV